MDVLCAKCGERGQLKLDKGKYYRVDHYDFRNGFRHGQWTGSCYIPLALAHKAGYDKAVGAYRENPETLARRPFLTAGPIQ